MTTGQRIRQLRKERGLTAAEMADALSKRHGVELLPSSISMYENDQRLPPTATGDALADFFRVSLDYLRGRSEVRNPEEQLAALNYPAEVQGLARDLTALSNGLRREFIERAAPIVSEMTAVHHLLVAELRVLVEKRGNLEEWQAKNKIKILE